MRGNAGPPKNTWQAPGGSQPRQAHITDVSSAEPYHRPSYAPRGFAFAACALAAHAWRELRKEVYS